jgi:hypothetical protein
MFTNTSLRRSSIPQSRSYCAVKASVRNDTQSYHFFLNSNSPQNPPAFADRHPLQAAWPQFTLLQKYACAGAQCPPHAQQLHKQEIEAQIFFFEFQYDTLHLEIFRDAEAISQRHFDRGCFLCQPPRCWKEGRLVPYFCKNCCKFAAG